MVTDEGIAIFETLTDIHVLIKGMTEVTLAYIYNIVTEPNSILLKNLLVDNYVNSLHDDTRNIITTRRSHFKDWLAEKISNPLSLQLKHNTVSPQWSLQLPLHTHNTNCCSTATRISRRLGTNSYCFQVFSTSVLTTPFTLETASTLFNEKFVCVENPNFRLTKADRSRNSSTSVTQLFKCSCNTSQLKFQFRYCCQNEVPHTTTQVCTVTVSIKLNMTSTFNSHFRCTDSNNAYP